MSKATHDSKLATMAGANEEMTPMIFQEFMICNSEYELSEKDDDDQISSDGEFIDVQYINVF